MNKHKDEIPTSIRITRKQDKFLKTAEINFNEFIRQKIEADMSNFTTVTLDNKSHDFVGKTIYLPNHQKQAIDAQRINLSNYIRKKLDEEMIHWKANNPLLQTLQEL